MTDVAAHTMARRIRTGTGIALMAAAVLVLSVVLAVSVGAVAIPPSTVWAIALDRVAPGLVASDWSAGRANIVWEIRFPRVILAGLVGAGLGLVGAALQAVTRNPLADPHLLGISSGGAFGAIAALLHTGMFLGLLTVPLMAFGGALLATMLVLGVARLAGASSADRLV
ncbi:MAG: iron chelate uptake ABC transporter family permease subunit, partial [Alphaproteobacteria bacterium]